MYRPGDRPRRLGQIEVPRALDAWLGCEDPLRRGCPVGVGGLADHVNSPTFATGVGLALYGYRNSMGDPARAPVGAGALVRAAGRLRGLFKEFF